MAGRPCRDYEGCPSTVEVHAIPDMRELRPMSSDRRTSMSASVYSCDRSTNGSLCQKHACNSQTVGMVPPSITYSLPVTSHPMLGTVNLSISRQCGNEVGGKGLREIFLQIACGVLSVRKAPLEFDWPKKTPFPSANDLSCLHTLLQARASPVLRRTSDQKCSCRVYLRITWLPHPRPGSPRPRSSVHVTRAGPTSAVTRRPRMGSRPGFHGASVNVSSRRMMASLPEGVEMARS